MATSRSTPRVRLLTALYAASIGIVACSERDLLPGAAGRVLQLAGLACIVLAALWRIWTSVFIAGFKDATLVTTGPYSACRHPLYAGSLLLALGTGLASRSLVLIFALPTISAWLHSRAIAEEERFLAGLHSAAYEEYRRRVPMLWPDWTHYEVPAHLVIQPPILRKAFFDAGAMLAAWALIVVADRLQTGGVLPALLRLP